MQIENRWFQIVFVEYKHINHTELFFIEVEDANFWNWFEVEQEHSGASIAQYDDFGSLYDEYLYQELMKPTRNEFSKELDDTIPF